MQTADLLSKSSKARKLEPGMKLKDAKARTVGASVVQESGELPHSERSASTE